MYVCIYVYIVREVPTYNRVLFKEQNHVIYRKLGGTRDHHVKPDSERQVQHIFSHMWNLERKKKKRHESKKGDY
jgi:hypothetical protein